jgi:hypothetical protein
MVEFYSQSIVLYLLPLSIHMGFVASFMKRKFVWLLHCAANHYYTKKVFVFLQYDILLLQMCLTLTLSSVAEKT